MLISKHIQFGRPLRLSSWRKIAIGTWRTVGDPSVYGILDLEVTEVIKYLEKTSQEKNQKLTITHFLGKAAAHVLHKHPEINCILRWGRLYPRKSVDIFFQVASDAQGKDLSGVTVRNINTKSLLEVGAELAGKAKMIREKGDQDYRKMKKTVGSFPGILANLVINLSGFILYGLNLWSPLFGSPRDPFGSMMITSIGSLGLDTAFAPLVPYSRIPVILALGTIREQAIAKDGKVVIAPVCRVCATFDHRLIDGMHASHMIKTLKKIFENPEMIDL